MPITIEELVVELRGEIGDLKKALKEAADETKEKAGFMTRSFEVFTGVVSSHALLGAIEKLKESAVGLFETYVVEGVKAAEEQENAENRLTQALIASGKYSKESAASLVEYADALQGSTKYANENIVSASALIQSLGRLDEDALKKATLSALNLSTALGIDLNTAALAVGKAAAGSAAALGRYGIHIEDGNTKAETFAKTLDALNTRFGGAAESAVNTYSGALARLTNQRADETKAIGNVIIKNQSLINVINVLSEQAAETTKHIQEHRAEYSRLVSDGILLVIDSTSVLVDIFNTAHIAALKLAQGYYVVEAGAGALVEMVPGLDGLVKSSSASAEDFERLGAEISSLEKGSGAVKVIQDSLDRLRNAALEGYDAINEGAKRSTNSLGAAGAAMRELSDEQQKLQDKAQKLVEGDAHNHAKKIADEIALIREAEAEKLKIKGRHGTGYRGPPKRARGLLRRPKHEGSGPPYYAERAPSAN
jgi:hypothetical protein